MTQQASNLWKRLRGFLTADLGRFADGSAVSDPLGLLAVERERVAALRPRQPDGSAQAAPTAGQGTQPGACGNVTGRTEREPGGINLTVGASPTLLSDGERETGACANGPEGRLLAAAGSS